MPQSPESGAAAALPAEPGASDPKRRRRIRVPYKDPPHSFTLAQTKAFGYYELRGACKKMCGKQCKDNKANLQALKNAFEFRGITTFSW